MFTYDARDDGFLVRAADGRSVASIECRNNKGEVMVRDAWKYHFTGHRLTITELGILINSTPAAFDPKKG